jgi:radical SAM superfamily enzyme YgiQ (UPF0313 family)
MSQILFVDVWGGVAMYPSLSIGYLSSVAKQEGYSSKIICPVAIKNFSVSLFEKILKKEKPKIVAFTLFTTQVFNAYKLIKVAKKFGSKIIAGGPHVSALGGKEVIKECPEIDHVFIREAEKTFATFLKSKINKQIIENKDFIEDLDSIPFPDRSGYFQGQWTYDSNYLYLPIHILIASRGCPYQCNFCFKDSLGYKYRQRSVENVLKECEEIKRLGGKELMFIDDLFAFDKTWIINFCKEKIKRKIDLPFKCLGRADRLNDEMLYWLSKAGCHTLSIGVETGNEEVLKWVNKGMTLKQIEEMVPKIHKNGINVEAYFIIGHRIDTEKTINETIEFARKINADFPRFFIFSPYPGSKIWKELPEEMKEKYWLKGIESDLRSTKPISICSVSPERLNELWHKAHDRAYSNPRYIFNILRSFKQNPFHRSWIKKTINFVGGGILKLHKYIYK